MIPALSITRNEFYMTMFNPMVIIIGLLLLTITFLNAAGGVPDLQSVGILLDSDGFAFGFSQIMYRTNFICGIMAAYLGVMSISSERGKGSLGIMLTKPLYRRDIILGKFIGINLFLFVFLIIIMLANSIFILYFYGAPSAVFECLWRVMVYTLVLLMDLSLVTGITMLIGVLFKDLLLAVSVTVTYLSYEWFWNSVTGPLSSMLNFPVAPYMLALRIYGATNSVKNDLFNTSFPFSGWISDAYPYLLLMIFLVVAMLLLDCFIYARTEDV